MLVETKDERVTRLSKHDAEVKQHHVQAMYEEVYKDLTFKPDLVKSKELAANKHSSLEDLVENPKGKAVREEVRRRVQEEEKSDLTFRPKIPEYRSEHGHYDEGEVNVLSHAGTARVHKENKVNLDPYSELYGDDLPRVIPNKDFHDVEAPTMLNQSGIAYGVDESFSGKLNN